MAQELLDKIKEIINSNDEEECIDETDPETDFIDEINDANPHGYTLAPCVELWVDGWNKQLELIKKINERFELDSIIIHENYISTSKQDEVLTTIFWYYNTEHIRIWSHNKFSTEIIEKELHKLNVEVFVALQD